MIECAKSPTGDHCPHELTRQYYTAGDAGTMTKTERCCFCEHCAVLRFTRGPAEGHGRFAPGVWVPSNAPPQPPHNGGLIDDGTLTGTIFDRTP